MDKNPFLYLEPKRRGRVQKSPEPVGRALANHQGDLKTTMPILPLHCQGIKKETLLSAVLFVEKFFPCICASPH